MTIHLDIQDEKIWIKQNTTEFDLASDLVEMGVPKQDIAIGFHTPKMRQLTGFAVGSTFSNPAFSLGNFKSIVLC